MVFLIHNKYCYVTFCLRSIFHIKTAQRQSSLWFLLAQAWYRRSILHLKTNRRSFPEHTINIAAAITLHCWYDRRSVLYQYYKRASRFPIYAFLVTKQCTSPPIHPQFVCTSWDGYTLTFSNVTLVEKYICTVNIHTYCVTDNTRSLLFVTFNSKSSVLKWCTLSLFLDSHYVVHHHHMSVMELGRLLTRSGLTYLEVSSEVCHDSFCQLGNSVSLSWVVCREAFCLHVVSGSSCIPTVYLEPVLSRSLFRGLPRFLLPVGE